MNMLGTFNESTFVLPEGENSESIIEIVEFCSRLCDFSDKNVKKIIAEKTQRLKRLNDIVSDPIALRAMDSSTLNGLFNMIQVNLIRDIPPPPPEYIYADSKVMYSASNWIHLGLIHKILHSIVVNYDPAIISNYLSKNFMAQYIYLLSSPDNSEQNTVEIFIYHVFNSVPGFRQVIFNTFVKLLKRYIDNSLYYQPVSMTLKFFLYYFKSLSSPLKPQYISLYQILIFPLISKPFMFDFFESFHLLSTFYVENIPNLASWSLEFMFKHWPVTDSNKITAFLAHLVPLASSLNVLTLKPLVRPIFLRLSSSLLSPNYKVSSTALELLLNPKFIFSFNSFSKEFIPLLFRGIDHCSRHWNQDVRKMSSEVYRTLFAIDSQTVNKLKMDSMPEMSSEDIPTARYWLIIAQQSKSIDANIDLDIVRSYIEKKFGLARLCL